MYSDDLKGDGALYLGLGGMFCGNELSGYSFVLYFSLLGDFWAKSISGSGSSESPSGFEKYLSLNAPEGTKGLLSPSSFKIPYFYEFSDSLDD